MQELWFLRSACRLMLINFYIKFSEDSSSVFKLQSGHEFVMDKVPRKIIKKV